MTDQAAEGTDSPIFRIYGTKLQKVKIAWLSTGNGVGFEIFEFIDPPTKSADEVNAQWSLEHQYQRGGFFHIGGYNTHLTGRVATSLCGLPNTETSADIIPNAFRCDSSRSRCRRGGSLQRWCNSSRGDYNHVRRRESIVYPRSLGQCYRNS